MKTIVLAYHELGAAGLKAAIRNGLDVVAVFTHRDDPSEGGWYTSVAREAAAAGIPVFAPEKLDHPIWIERIKEMKADLLLSCHYRNMVGAKVRELFPKGCINLHSAMLPKYRGRCPINWVLVNGETETGVMLHYMSEKADAGDIIGQRKVKIDITDTARTLTASMSQATSDLLDELLPLVKANKAPRTPQDEKNASSFGRRTPDDGNIDWTKSAEEIRNLTRAVAFPWPGAFTFAGERKFMVWTTKLRKARASLVKFSAPIQWLWPAEMAR